MRLVLMSLAVFSITGCATIIDGHERGLYYSAGSGLHKETVASGWHWHAPWNNYRVYDMRFDSHNEEVHIHSKDNLHLNVIVAAVVRPKPDELYALDTDVGPDWYNDLVKPSLLAATRDAAAQLNHLQIATQTHEFEEKIEAALKEHLDGNHIELSQVAVQHFDLPPEVEQAANRKAASEQQLAARDIDLKLGVRDAEIDQNRRKAQAETVGLEKRLKAQQDLEQAQLDRQIAEERRKAEQVRLDTEADAVRIKAKAQADAMKMEAEAEKVRIASTSANLSSNYLRLKSIEALSAAFANNNAHTYVVPTGKDGMPAMFMPFLNPYGPYFGGASAAANDAKAGP